VYAHLIFGVLAIAAEQILRLLNLPGTGPDQDYGYGAAGEVNARPRAGKNGHSTPREDGFEG
jgi:hypothetical protein